MAKVSFIGFVNEWRKDSDEKHPNWAFKCGEPHRKKLSDGGYETIGTTYWVVKNGWDSTNNAPVHIDFTQFSVGDRVEVTGVSVTEKWESNGKKGTTLVCKAENVKFVVSQVAQVTPQAGTVDRGYEKAVVDFDAELPF